MKSSNFFSLLAESNGRRSCLCTLLPTAALLSLVFFTGTAFIGTEYKEKLSRWHVIGTLQDTKSKTLTCKGQCSSYGSEVLPKGIVSRTSNFEMRPLWGSPKRKKNAKDSMNLLAVAAGVKQKQNINKMVKKFPSSDFVVMLFHYDGVVDEWNDFEWNDRAIHVSAINQTKWWFAKRFLHPDIVAEYNFIFLWDEDLGVENFDPRRYIKIVKDEGLEISQPALDPAKSEVHHQITARGRRSKVHRRIYKSGRGRRCDGNSTAPPCTGWVEMMAPVFSRAAWRCAWHMIQNDLIHAWGLDMQLGYCAQGDRTKNVGVVDAEYIVHQGLPTLGGIYEKSNSELTGNASPSKRSSNVEASAPSTPHGYNDRSAVRRQSYIELEIFKNRWKKAVKEDECWIDPYQQPAKKNRR